MTTVRTGRRYRSGRAEKHYDVVVIGSGIGGLTTAALLSLLGKKVCVLEQHYTAGGYTHAYERNGFEWDVGVHYIGEVHNPHSTLRRVFDVVSQERLQWVEMEPVYDRIYLGSKSYELVAGRDNFIQTLKQRFPEEGEAITRYVELIRKISHRTPRFFAGQAMPPALARLYNLVRPLLVPAECFETTRRVLEKLTTNQELISVLTGQWGDYGLPPEESAFLMHALVAKHYLAGGAYPLGGSSSIARSIIPTIQSGGGEVFTYAEVEQVLVNSNRAIGVRMRDGSEIRADQVVSNTGVLTTFNRLLPDSVSSRIGADKWVTELKHSSAHMCLYAGFDGTAKGLNLGTTNLWIYPDGHHELNLKRFLDDPEQEFPLVYISFPSAKDQDWNYRYPNKSTVEVVTVANRDWFERWQDSIWSQRGEDYEAFKEQFAQRLLDILFQHRPQLRERLLFHELSTPLSTEWFQNNERGEIYGVDHGVDRFRKPFLHPVTPVKGLYMTGADVMTAGVGGAMMGGVMAASAMQGLRGKEVFKLLKNYRPLNTVPEAEENPVVRIKKDRADSPVSESID